MKVLLVEDHESLGAAIKEAVDRARFVTDWVRTLEEVDAALAATTYDLILLDLGLPDGDGLEFLRRCRTSKLHTPIIVLTARGGLNDRIAGLDDGADDYLVKPFPLAELISRCRAVLRRPNRLAVEPIRVGQLEFLPATGDVTLGARPLVLSRREQQLLVALMRRCGRVCSRTLLEATLYQHDSEVGPNAIETAVSRLRTYLARCGANVNLQTIRGVGYVLRDAGNG